MLINHFNTYVVTHTCDSCGEPAPHNQICAPCAVSDSATFQAMRASMASMEKRVQELQEDSATAFPDWWEE
ncbi:MAG TPA: hypothetical protein V6D20_04590 [Candidatus Obscuribacterales bacterium]